MFENDRKLNQIERPVMINTMEEYETGETEEGEREKEEEKREKGKMKGCRGQAKNDLKHKHTTG